jgi:hypothetical protein
MSRTPVADHALLSDLGLLAEEVSPVSGELSGDHPQALSHIGLVDAAWAMNQAERRRPGIAGTRRPHLVHPDTSPLGSEV